MFEIALIIAAALVLLWFVFAAPRKPTSTRGRVVWRESDTEARQRIADRWEPSEHFVGERDVEGDRKW